MKARETTKPAQLVFLGKVFRNVMKVFPRVLGVTAYSHCSRITRCASAARPRNSAKKPASGESAPSAYRLLARGLEYHTVFVAEQALYSSLIQPRHQALLILRRIFPKSV